MKESTKEAFAEIDTILELMNEEDKNAVPETLRNIIKDKKSKEYKKNIVPDKPLKEQGLSEEAKSLLAVLNYNFWCKDEKRRQELTELYLKNEEIYQKKLREKYDVNNIFKNDNDKKIEKDENTDNDEKAVELVEYEEKWYKKIFNKILSFFKK